MYIHLVKNLQYNLSTAFRPNGEYIHFTAIIYYTIHLYLKSSLLLTGPKIVVVFQLNQK